MIEKKRPIATIERVSNEDGTRSYDDIVYKCPTCSKYIGRYKNHEVCFGCGTIFDWGTREPTIKVTKTVEW